MRWQRITLAVIAAAFGAASALVAFAAYTLGRDHHAQDMGLDD